ncbi:MAG: type II toxin-antitoxin system VapC family toxin [Desulfococcaceae bacterium]
MNLYYFDSSALVKQYVYETGSLWVQAVTASNLVFVSRITRVEVLSALSRLKREGKIDSPKLSATMQLFDYDWIYRYHIVELDHQITEHAGQLVQQYPLRAYDSVQLATALKLHSFYSVRDLFVLIFVSADDRLLNAAQSEKMFGENPNIYPNMSSI